MTEKSDSRRRDNFSLPWQRIETKGVNRPRKAVLAMLDTGRYDADYAMSELIRLREAAGFETVGQVYQKRPAPDPATALGGGKCLELKKIVRETGADICIFECELSGGQVRNLSDMLGREVIDRTVLILRIFSRRAASREGKLQAELARLEYALPRMTYEGYGLSRQGGGGGGSAGARRGTGETRSEADRRHVLRRIESLKKKLERTRSRRRQITQRRAKSFSPVIALAGYTNVGKSSLMNALSKPGEKGEALRRNMLFATLDPTARKLSLPDGTDAILTDTVGFVSRLPHSLVNAFRSTLEQAKHADVILNVADISSPMARQQLEITLDTLRDIGCRQDRIITVYNKADLAPATALPPSALTVSAVTGRGLDRLLWAVCEKLKDRQAAVELLLPYEKSALVSTIAENGRIFALDYREDGIRIKGRVDRKFLYLFTSYKA